MHNNTTTNNNNSNNTNITSARVNTTQACAACKYQRRKCAPDCNLAPYFPHDRQRQFLNAHKLFGVSNITKIIRNLDQPKKDAAMRTIIFQSDVRASDPVGGCYRIIQQLQRQIDYTKAELEIVFHQLALCQAQAQAQAQTQLAKHQQQQILVANHDTTDSSNAANWEIDTSPLGLYEQLQMNYHHLHPHHLEQYIIQAENAALQEDTSNNSWGIPQEGSTTGSSIMAPIAKQHSLTIKECNDFRPVFDGDTNDFRFESDKTIETRFVS